MPQFILNCGDDESARKLCSHDAFTQAYVEALFFTGIEDPSDDTGNTDADVSVADLSPEAWERITADCATFRDNMETLWELAGSTDEQAGHDFWLTRNGHGAGFWDRGYPEHLSKALTDAAHAYGECDPYLGDDDLIYLA
jgi:hypothetical protein